MRRIHRIVTPYKTAKAKAKASVVSSAAAGAAPDTSALGRAPPPAGPTVLPSGRQSGGPSSKVCRIRLVNCKAGAPRPFRSCPGLRPRLRRNLLGQIVVHRGSPPLRRWGDTSVLAHSPLSRTIISRWGARKFHPVHDEEYYLANRAFFVRST